MSGPSTQDSLHQSHHLIRWLTQAMGRQQGRRVGDLARAEAEGAAYGAVLGFALIGVVVSLWGAEIGGLWAPVVILLRGVGKHLGRRLLRSKVSTVGEEMDRLQDEIDMITAAPTTMQARARMLEEALHRHRTRVFGPVPPSDPSDREGGVAA